MLTLVLTMVIVFAMTSAWYTNIVQTSGLVFQAEAWGFDGTITVDETPIVAAPGDVGTVNLEVENKGDITALSVNISKATMHEDMRKRMYFYVDTQHTRNGETMERVYLNNQESYTYTIFNDGKLTLTEKLHNDAQIKWMWVYDVLGYYVLGEYDRTRGMKELEYLRPIEYNYDASTSTFVTDEEGNLDFVLSTVDGTKTVEQFLQEVSSKDGYAGTIDTNGKVYGNGYYPVEVTEGMDGEAYGIFAYLCNYAEIEEATEFDTKLGQAAYQLAKDPDSIPEEEKEKMKYTATMTLSAQKSDNVAMTVSTAAGLQTAIAAEPTGVIQLTSNVTLSPDNPLVIPAEARVMLDLNGQTIVYEGGSNAITAQPGSSVTIVNGTMQGGQETGEAIISDTAVYATGAEVVLSNVTVEDFYYGVYVGDHKNNEKALDSRVHVVGGSIDSDYLGVFVAGNGTASEQKTQVVLENTKISGGIYALVGNGNATSSGTDIQILNSELHSTDMGTEKEPGGAAIYHPQKDSTMLLYNSKVTGYTGIVVKGGSATITDSTITASGKYETPPVVQNSGSADPGVAVYLETNYTDREIYVEINGTSKLTSTNSYAFLVSEATENVSAKIVSGEFTQPEKAFDQAGTEFTLDKAENLITPYLAEGSTGTMTGGTFTVTQATS